MGLFAKLFPNFAAALKPIPFLEGSGDFGQAVVGELQYQRTLERIAGGCRRDGVRAEVTAFLHLDNDNRHDPNAVCVKVSGRTIGYLSVRDALAYRERLAEIGHAGCAVRCKAIIVGGFIRDDGERGFFGSHGQELGVGLGQLRLGLLKRDLFRRHSPLGEQRQPIRLHLAEARIDEESLAVAVGIIQPLHVTSDNARDMKVDRYNSDGELLSWARDDAAMGSVTVTAGTEAYGAITGVNYGRLSDEDTPVGALVSLTG